MTEIWVYRKFVGHGYSYRETWSLRHYCAAHTKKMGNHHRQGSFACSM